MVRRESVEPAFQAGNIHFLCALLVKMQRKRLEDVNAVAGGKHRHLLAVALKPPVKEFLIDRGDIDHCAGSMPEQQTAGDLADIARHNGPPREAGQIVYCLDGLQCPLALFLAKRLDKQLLDRLHPQRRHMQGVNRGA